jgi:hypothetical protein
LVTKLASLGDCLQAAQVTVLEDAPAPDECVLVEQFGNSILDIRGLLAEASAAANEAALRPADLDRARSALAKCQERCLQITRRFATELISYERISDLTNLGRSRRGAWPAWSRSVKQAVESCRHPLDESGEALFQCWQDIGERAGTTSVSVHTTTVGQRFAGDLGAKKSS